MMSVFNLCFSFIFFFSAPDENFDLVRSWLSCDTSFTDIPDFIAVPTP
jgi:hypothetical protein